MRAARAVVILSVFSLTARAQAPFRAGTDVIPIYATVRGADGHLLTGLEQSDFTVLERGEPVPLAVFSNEPQPITSSVLIDMSGNWFNTAWYAQLRKGLLAFVGELRPDDRARIGTFSGNEIGISFHLTSDHGELQRVIQEEIWVGGWGVDRPLWNAIGVGMTSLRSETGRRVVLVLTNGADNTADIPGFPGPKDVERMMHVDDFMVYAISLFESNVIRPVGWAPESSPPIGLTLRQLVDDTGGGYFRALDESRTQYWRHPVEGLLASRLAGVVDELRHQYALGFVPRHRDGRIGKIEVRVKRPNATVSARKTYPAPAKAS
jgi:VWFA-related protein